MITNGLVAIENERDEIRKGIKAFKQYLEKELVNNYNNYISRITDIINGAYCPNIEERQKAELEKAQNLLALAKKHAMTNEMEELQALIKLLPEKEAQCQEPLIKGVSDQFEAMEQPFSEFLEEVGKLPIENYDQVSAIRALDSYHGVGYGIEGWERRLNGLLDLAKQLKLTDKMQVIKNRFTTFETIKQQVEDYEKKLEAVNYQVSELLRVYWKIPFEKLKRKLHLSDEELTDLLETLIDKGDIQAHIEGTYLYRK